MDLQLEDTDTLSGLEDRILRAVQLVSKLKEENAALKERLAAVESEGPVTAALDAQQLASLIGLLQRLYKGEAVE